jgi:hypothetical protein
MHNLGSSYITYLADEEPNYPQTTKCFNFCTPIEASIALKNSVKMAIVIYTILDVQYLHGFF